MIPRARAAAYALWFYGVTLVFGLAGLAVRLFARDRALAFAQAWVRTALAGLEPICGIRVQVTGLEHLPTEGPALLASQHQSAFDTLVWMTLLARPSYVMKQELRRIPLFGPMLVPAGMIPLDRGAGTAALRGLLRACGQAASAGRQIVVFPEGTRVAPAVRVPLHPGIVAVAAHTGLPVLPVATDSGGCWPRDLLGKRAGVIHIAIGAPIPASSRRDAMLAQVEAFWRQSEASQFKPVDNSVDPAPPQARSDGLRTG